MLLHLIIVVLKEAKIGLVEIVEKRHVFNVVKKQAMKDFVVNLVLCKVGMKNTSSVGLMEKKQQLPVRECPFLKINFVKLCAASTPNRRSPAKQPQMRTFKVIVIHANILTIR